MDKTILAGGIALTGLGAGFLAAYQAIPDLHSAYLIGGYMWIGVGVITAALGIRKQERLGQKGVKAEMSHEKNAIGI